MSNVIIITGKPNVGKGTILTRFLNDERKAYYEHVSTGDALRKARRAKTEVGKLAAQYMDAGELVPDDVINGIIREAVSSTDKHVLLDGYPRNREQAQNMLESGLVPNLVICLDVENKVLYERMANRIVCENCNATYTLNDYHPPKEAGVCDCCGGKLLKRLDDTEEALRKRLEVFEEQTLPAIEFLERSGVPVIWLDNDFGGAYALFESLMQRVDE